ncbi:acyl-CoA dehydrogenase family protein [bacterium]|nr:acyl-CoA dehydrogenase family protein [bacterium]
MDWLGLNKDHLLLGKDIAEFAVKELKETVLDFDKESKLFSQPWQKAAQLGLFGILLPESLGGAEMDLLSLIVCLEELSAVSPSFALAVAGQNVAGYAIHKFCLLPDKESILKKIIKGAPCGISFGDICNLECDSFENQVSGESSWILNGENCQYFLSFGSCRESWFILQNDRCCEFRKEEESLGMRSAGMGKFAVSKASLKEDQFLQEDGGVIMELFRVCGAGIAAGISMGCYEQAVPYARERVQFGRPISKFGMVRQMLSGIEESRRIGKLLTYDAAIKFGKGDKLASLVASTVARDLAFAAANYAVQVLGGAGYTKDYQAEMFFRDAKALEILFGPPQEEKELIGKIISD